METNLNGENLHKILEQYIILLQMRIYLGMCVRVVTTNSDGRVKMLKTSTGGR